MAPGPIFASVVLHRPALENVKWLSTTTDSLLAKEDRTRSVETSRHRYQENYRDCDDETQEPNNEIHHPFQKESYRRQLKVGVMGHTPVLDFVYCPLRHLPPSGFP